MIPKLAQVTINPAIITPLVIIGKAYPNRIPNKNAATEPVQTPVPGRGIATKNNKNNAPYFSYRSSCLRVLWKSHSKNTSKPFHFRKNFEKGFRYSNKKNAGIRFPRTAKT